MALLEQVERIVNLCWYVLHAKPRKEEFLRDQLGLRRIEVFCPYLRVHVVNPRARKTRPYFPGYLFVHLDLVDMSPLSLQWMPGSCGFVSFGGEPATVSDSMIHSIRQRADQVNAAGGELFHDLKLGDAVRVIEGPFVGYDAIFDARLPGSERVRVLLKLLQKRQMAVELPAGYIGRLKSPLRTRQ